MRTVVKPCPFCGGPAKLEPMPDTNNNWWRVRCADYACGGTTYPRGDEESATAAWNRRAVDG